MDYDKLSDFEINKAVTRICYPTSSDFQNGEGESIWFRCGRYNDHKDYCNNPADAWPIILSHRIGVAPATVGDK